MSKYILCALLGYFAGCFSPSYLLSRRRGFDIRTFGSGNAGATNMMLAAGLKPGLVVMALDVSKAFAVTLPLRLLLPPLCAALAGLFCVLGHIFPVFLHFRGGKGTACLCGTVLGLTPELVLPLPARSWLYLCSRSGISSPWGQPSQQYRQAVQGTEFFIFSAAASSKRKIWITNFY